MNSNLKNYLKYEAKLELARRSVWYFCKLKAPDFYTDDKKYLKNLCNELQDFIVSDKKVLLINMPPRHGKSRTVGLFTEWYLGNYPKNTIITASYNEKLSTMFSKQVRNDIQEIKADKNKIVYNDIFPIHIKRGDGSSNMWSLEGSHISYLSTSPSGTVTGVGCQIMIIDDLIKNAEEAFNENIKENHKDWFTNTMLSRLETGGKIIIIATRWSYNDLSGVIQNIYNQDEIQHINYAAYKNNKMLCEDILTYEEYEEKRKLIAPEIFEANYNQNLIDTNKCLYTSFKFYKELPTLNAIYTYCDFADKGQDYLCSITFGINNMEIYILSVIYTQLPPEKTEQMVAKQLYDNKVNLARFEGNNGGRIFAKNVQDILIRDYKTNATTIKTFHQTKNKEARILSNSTWIMEHVYFPENIYVTNPEFFNHLKQFQRSMKNAHDDAEDALTGVVETVRQIYHI